MLICISGTKFAQDNNTVVVVWSETLQIGECADLAGAHHFPLFWKSSIHEEVRMTASTLHKHGLPRPYDRWMSPEGREYSSSSSYSSSIEIRYVRIPDAWSYFY